MQRQAYLAELAALGKLQAEHPSRSSRRCAHPGSAALQTEANLNIAEAAGDRAEEMAARSDMPKANSPTLPKKESGVSAGGWAGPPAD